MSLSGEYDFSWISPFSYFLSCVSHLLDLYEGSLLFFLNILAFFCQFTSAFVAFLVFFSVLTYPPLVSLMSAVLSYRFGQLVRCDVPAPRNPHATSNP